MITKNWRQKRKPGQLNIPSARDKGNDEDPLGEWKKITDWTSCLTITHEAEADFGLADGGTASQQAEDEHDDADADDDGRRDHRVFILDEAVEVVIAPDHVGSDVGQHGSCSLWGRGWNVSMSPTATDSTQVCCTTMTGNFQ